MKAGKRWASWKVSAAGPILALPMLFCAAGCLKDRAFVEKNLLTQSSQDVHVVAQQYRIGCPDVIDLEIPQRPEFNGRYPIGSDGRIDLGDYGQPRLEGRTPGEAARMLAAETGVNQANIHLRVSDYRSQHVLLFGEINGSQRSVPYRGPETVLDLLQRAGGITHGGAPDDVYVVRPHVGENRRPEVFKIDLYGILANGDQQTNLRLLPFDQIYVGETRRAKIEKAVPPWLRWVIWDVKPEVRSQRSEVSDQRSKIGDQDSEVKYSGP